MGATLDGEAACAIAYFGDGASSQGEIHEAMNFAAVFSAPVIFFCQNNGWAISVPVEKQVAGGSVAARAAGYGIPGIRVDGNDVEAVRDATAAAVLRARSGEGPTVIEAMTYRLGPHATSDDPRRYRSAEEEANRRELDPLVRTRAKLLATTGATEQSLAAIETAAQAEAAELRAAFADMPKPTFSDHLERVYRDTPPQVAKRNRDWLELTHSV
jgi:pyruvate dehydrogenase E1 component alpha subunit